MNDGVGTVISNLNFSYEHDTEMYETLKFRVIAYVFYKNNFLLKADPFVKYGQDGFIMEYLLL